MSRKQMSASRFSQPEDALALGMQQALADEVLDAASGGEGRVERHPRIGPLDAVVELLAHELPDSLVPYVDRARGEGAIVVDQTLVDLEDVHGCSLSADVLDAQDQV